MADLTSGVESANTQWTVLYDEANKVVVRHQMEIDTSLDDVIAFRDPDNPTQPHPLYVTYVVDKEGVSHRTKTDVVEAELQHGFKAELRRLFEAYARRQESPEESSDSEWGTQSSARRPQRKSRLSEPQLTQIVESMKQNVLAELKRTIDGRSREHPPYVPCAMGPEHLKPYEGTQEEQDRNREAYGGQEETERYEVGSKRKAPHDEASGKRTGPREVVVFSGLGGGNSMGMANTSLDPLSEEPAFDMDEINAYLIPFDVEMIDKDGIARSEVVNAVVLIGNVKEGQQVRLFYGKDFLPHFAGNAADAANSAKRVHIKPDPDGEAA
jgi:hypothetical protein